MDLTMAAIGVCLASGAMAFLYFISKMGSPDSYEEALKNHTKALETTHASKKPEKKKKTVKKRKDVSAPTLESEADTADSSPSAPASENPTPQASPEPANVTDGPAKGKKKKNEKKAPVVAAVEESPKPSPVEQKAGKGGKRKEEKKTRPIVEEAVQEVMVAPVQAAPVSSKPPAPVVEAPMVTSSVSVTKAAPPQGKSVAPTGPKGEGKKGKKEKAASAVVATNGDIGVDMGKIAATLSDTPLSKDDIQELVDMLLAKQEGAINWTKNFKTRDPMSVLKKQLEDKEALLVEEQKKAETALNRLKDSKTTLMQAEMKAAERARAAEEGEKELKVLRASLKAQTAQLALLKEKDAAIQKLTVANKKMEDSLPLESELKGMKTQLDIVHRELSTNIRKLQEAEGKNATLRKEHAAAQGELEKSRSQEKANHTRVQELVQQLEVSPSHKDSPSTDQHKALERELEELRTKKEELEAARLSGEGRVAAMVTEIEKVRAEAKSEVAKLITSKDSEIKDLKKTMSELAVKQQAAATVQNGHPEKIELTVHEKLLAAKDQEVSHLKVTVSEKEKALKERLEEAGNSERLLQERLVASERALADVRLQGEKAAAQASSENAGLKERLAQEVTAVKAEWKNETAQLKAQAEKEASAAKTQASSKASSQEEVAKLKTLLAKALDSVKAGDSRLAEVTAALKKAEQSGEKVEASERQLKEAVEKLNKKNDELRRKNWAAMESLGQQESLAGSVPSLNTEVDKLKVANTELKAYMTQLETQNSDLSAKCELLSKSSESASASEKELKSLKRALSEKEEQVAGISAKLTKSETALEDMQEECQKMLVEASKQFRAQLVTVDAARKKAEVTLTQTTAAAEAKSFEIESLKADLEFEKQASDNLREKYVSGVNGVGLDLLTCNNDLSSSGVKDVAHGAGRAGLLRLSPPAPAQQPEVTTSSSPAYISAVKLSGEKALAPAELQKLQTDLEGQKKKNDDLRQKNHKLVEALRDAEDSTKSSKSAPAPVVSQPTTAVKREVLARLFPNVTVSESLDATEWSCEFEKQVRAQLESSASSGPSAEYISEITGYRSALNAAEGMLNTVQSKAEDEERVWAEKVKKIEAELTEVRAQLQKDTSGGDDKVKEVAYQAQDHPNVGTSV